MSAGAVGSKFVALLLILIFLSATPLSVSAPFATISPANISQCSGYPCPSSIKIIGYGGDDSASVSALINNQIAAYDSPLTPAELASLPASFGQIGAPTTMYEVLVNPENTSWSDVSAM